MPTFNRSCIQFVRRGTIILLLATMPVLIVTRSDSHETSSPAGLAMKEGAQAFERGAFGEALSHWKQAMELYKSSGNAPAQVEALVLSAQASMGLGQSKQALQSLELALALAQKSGDPRIEAPILGHLGRIYLALRQLPEASEYLQQAVDIAKKQKASPLMATTLNDLGILSVLKQQDKGALDAFQESVSHAQSAGLLLLGATARTNAARVLLRLGQPANSRVALDDALDHLKDLPPSRINHSALIGIALAYQRLTPQLPQAHDPLVLRTAGVLQEAATLAEQQGDKRTLSYALGYLGHLYETEFRMDEALQFTRRALFVAQAVDAPESLYRWQWQLGRQLAATGQLDQAIASYRQATVTLQPIRVEIAQASSDGHVADQDTVKPLFFELADLLLQRASLTEDAKAAEGYLLSARDAIEAYKTAELRDYFKDDCVDAVRSRLTTLFDRLSSDTAVIYPIMFSSRLELLMSLPSGLKRISVPVTAERLTQEIREFRRLIEKRTTREYVPHAQQLYDWLIRPLETDLSRLNITTLVFVPDSALRTIPLAALHDGSSFLISKFALAMTPGLTLTDPRPLNRDKLRFLTAGLTKSVQEFPALPYVADEVESIQRHYKSDQLLNNAFQASRLERELREGRYGGLHIATHGRFSTEVNDSFLLTFDGKLTMQTLDQLIGLFRFRQEPLELLTLSACQTGVGDDRAALGLAGVALKAGARSALATLWFINDEASATLISEFYRQLRNPDLSKAVALQRAQLKLLGDRIYEHPAYWSPFLLLNNWL